MPSAPCWRGSVGKDVANTAWVSSTQKRRPPGRCFQTRRDGQGPDVDCARLVNVNHFGQPGLGEKEILQFSCLAFGTSMLAADSDAVAFDRRS